MIVDIGCWKPRRAALAIAMSLLSGCATGDSELLGTAVCPPVMEYGREFQARAAKEIARLPDGSAIAEMLGITP